MQRAMGIKVVILSSEQGCRKLGGWGGGLQFLADQLTLS